MMFQKQDAVQKRLVKIKKQETVTLKFLSKQQQELRKAVEENQKLITDLLDKESDEEKLLRREIEKLTTRRDEMEARVEKVRVDK